MKKVKIIEAMLVFIVVISMTGCFKFGKSNKESTTQKSEEELQQILLNQLSERYNQEFKILEFEHAVSPDALISFDSYEAIIVSSEITSKQYYAAIEGDGSHIRDDYGSLFFEDDIQEACQKIADVFFESSTVTCEVVYGGSEKIWTMNDKWTDFIKDEEPLIIVYMMLDYELADVDRESEQIEGFIQNAMNENIKGTLRIQYKNNDQEHAFYMLDTQPLSIEYIKEKLIQKTDKVGEE